MCVRSFSYKQYTEKQGWDRHDLGAFFITVRKALWYRHCGYCVRVCNIKWRKDKCS